MLQALRTLQPCKNTRQNGGVSTKRSASSIAGDQGTHTFQEANPVLRASMRPSDPQKIGRNGDSVNVLRQYLFHVNVALFAAALFCWAKPLVPALTVGQLNVTKDFQS